MRVNNYFELVWQVEMKIESNEQDIMIDKLPNYLKEELLLEIGFTKYIYFLYLLPKEKEIKKQKANLFPLVHKKINILNYS